MKSLNWGYKLIRMIFTVKKNYVQNVIKKIDQFFLPKKIFYERRISWPLTQKSNLVVISII